MQVYVVVIGTSGNQRYIFSSNKRREIVGASELITRAERRWADDALNAVFPGFSAEEWRIEHKSAELLTAGAGGLTVVVRDRRAGQRLVTEVTRSALAQAPGLDVCGVLAELRWNDDPPHLPDAIRAAHAQLPMVRAAGPGPESRFLRIPLTDQCSASGLPATEMWRPARDKPPEPRSAASVAKLKAYDDALKRLTEVAGLPDASKTRADVDELVDHLAEKAEWAAVVHADGNDLGAIFSSFEHYLPGGWTDRAYADALRDFSQGVDDCARSSFQVIFDRLKASSAVKKVAGLPPVLPLVLGGDDLTVVCDGAVALSFTHQYLEEFAAQVERHPSVGGLLKAHGEPPFGACAGVAIVKPHYPFHFAYELAEQLTTHEAKQVKTRIGRDRCALAYYVLYESAAPDLRRLRDGAAPESGCRLSAQPYVLGDQPEKPWARHRQWRDLEARVSALNRTDTDGERLVPRGAAHDLRAGLFLGRGVADARFRLLRSRCAGDDDRTDALDALQGDGDSLFWAGPDSVGVAGDTVDDAGTAITGLLDAMAAADFLKMAPPELTGRQETGEAS